MASLLCVCHCVNLVHIGLKMIISSLFLNFILLLMQPRDEFILLEATSHC